MSPLLKLLLPLVVVLPLGGFVAGSLASAAQDDPGPRTPIVLREDSSRTPTTGAPTDEPANPSRPPDDDDSGRDEEDDGDDDADEGDDQVVTPKPVDNDGDVGDDGDDGAEDDDDDGDEGDDD